jgi:cephalosporin-C deacetylase
MIIDLPVSELLTYQGENPRPADFDAYWAAAMEEVRGVDPNPELVPSDFTCSFAECFHLYFTGVRNARIHAKYFRPKPRPGDENTAKPRPGILRFHGYSANSGDWYTLLPFVAEGFVVAAMDARGQGGMSEDTGGVYGNTFHGQIIRGLDDKAENMLFRHIFLDTVQLVRVLSSFDEVDGERLGAFGGSQGGALTIACAALNPQVKKAAMLFPFLCDYKRVWKLDLGGGAYQELKDYFRWFDPRHERENEIFTRLGYIDLQFLAPRIKAEVLMLTGLNDIICPPSSQFAAYNKITSRKEVLFYPDYAHEDLADEDDIVFKFMADL